MKKMLLMAVIAGAAITTADAQVSFGPRVGVNFANYSNVDDSKSKTGFLVGAVANFGMNDLLSIQPEVLYSQGGFKMEDDGDKYTLATNYLQVPVLLKAGFGDGNLKFHANVGPYVGYWLSGKEKMEFDGESESESYEFDDDDADGSKDNRLDVGILAGVGLGIPTGAGTFNIDLRYGLGMSDMTSWKDDRPDGVDKVSNRVLSLSVAYMFGGN